MSKKNTPIIRKLYFQVVIGIVFLSMMWLSFGQNVLSPAAQSGAPDQLGDLKLVSSNSGPSVTAQVSKLHGTQIKLVNALIAEYAGGSERATVWVGVAKDRSDAANLLQQMLDAINKGGSGFGNVTKVRISSHDIFQADGPGGRHFFYQSHNVPEEVVWVSVQAADAMPAVRDAVMGF